MELVPAATGTLLVQGQTLPPELLIQMRNLPPMGGTSNFETQEIFFNVPHPSEGELADLNGPATIRIGDFGSFMLFSAHFGALVFDLLWLPTIAKTSGHPGLAEIEDGKHMVMSYVTIDEYCVVRNMRMGTLSPECSSFIARLQRELMSRDITDAQIQRDMNRLFDRFPGLIPDEVFNVTCQIGD